MRRDSFQESHGMSSSMCRFVLPLTLGYSTDEEGVAISVPGFSPESMSRVCQIFYD